MALILGSIIEIVFYNLETQENPSSLNISSRTGYWFQSATSVYGEGTDNSGPIPVDWWSWDYDPNDGTDLYDIASIGLDYGTTGHETYILVWKFDQENLKNRQTFSYLGTLGGFGAVRTTGYYEVVKH